MNPKIALLDSIMGIAAFGILMPPIFLGFLRLSHALTLLEMQATRLIEAENTMERIRSQHSETQNVHLENLSANYVKISVDMGHLKIQMVSPNFREHAQ